MRWGGQLAAPAHDISRSRTRWLQLVRRGLPIALVGCGLGGWADSPPPKLCTAACVSPLRRPTTHPQKLYAEQRMRALARVLVVFHQFLASQREKEAHEEEAAQARTERKRAADGDLRGAQRRKSGRARRRANA